MGKVFVRKRVAIVADWLTSRGGAEHVVQSLSQAFPKADIFTSVFEKKNFPLLDVRNVNTSFLQKFSKRHQFLLPFFPKAFESFDLSSYDLIISSSSSGYSKCVKKTRKDQIHVCYCHTPIRYLYHAKDEYLKEYPLPWFAKPAKLILPALLKWLQKKDQAAAQQVDYFLSNSDFVGKRIYEYYHKKASTIYPGVETFPFQQAREKYFQKKDYFFALGRFIPYKKFDLLIQTFSKNKLPLLLGGEGPEWERCKKMAIDLHASNIEFFGFVEGARLPRLFAEARAFIFPAEEDFGLTPVEAMSAGTPVIYLGRGGALESVNKDCGIPFLEQTPQSLQQGIDQFLEREHQFDRQKIMDHGQSFDERFFREKMIHFCEEIYKS